MGNSRLKERRTSTSGAARRSTGKSLTRTRSRTDIEFMEPGIRDIVVHAGRDRVAVKVTFVVFRGEVTALFRATKVGSGKWQKELPRYSNGIRMLPCYAHVGQHAECGEFLLKYRRATHEEYAPLLSEMRSVGYDVDVVQRGRVTLTERTGYACCWLDEYDNNEFGCYRVFSERGAALDWLTDLIFERAELLGVDVTDQGAKPVTGDDGGLDFPKMTWDQVRDQLGSGMDFGLVLRADWEYGSLTVREQALMGIREVTIV